MRRADDVVAGDVETASLYGAKIASHLQLSKED